jgi:hypothetical protein
MSSSNPAGLIFSEDYSELDMRADEFFANFTSRLPSDIRGGNLSSFIIQVRKSILRGIQARLALRSGF